MGHTSHQLGGEPLTARERAVLHLLAEGLPAKAMAREMGISPRTVGKHLERAYRKLGVNDRVLAVRALDLQRAAS